jgi:MFS family permease
MGSAEDMQLPQLTTYAVARVLRHRTFARFFAAQLTEDASDAIYLLILPFLVLESGGSGLAIGFTGSAAVLPYLLISPLAGVVVDRMNRSVVLIGSNMLRALTLFSLLQVGWVMGFHTWHLATAAFILTTADVVAVQLAMRLFQALCQRRNSLPPITSALPGGIW